MANDRRQNISTVQSRLAIVQDPLRRKLIDNNLYWISKATDCIRLKVKKSYEGDAVAYVVEKTDVVSVVLPPLTDVPYRKIKIDEQSRKWQLTSLVSLFEDGEQSKIFSVQIPHEFDIDVGDLLFVIMIDPAQKFPIIIPIQVTELLGTFGGQMIIMNKFAATIPTDNFPEEIVATIQDMAQRRLRLGF